MRLTHFLVLTLFPFLMKAQGEPALIPVESLSKHPIQQMEVNQINYHYIEAGKGETVFFLHGFPDMAGTWDETIDALKENYHCVAPFLRGYYPTGMASDSNYHPTTVARDIQMLAQKMGVSKFYVVGQDWGASVAYSIVSMFPEQVIKAVTIAIPHTSTIKFTPRTIWRARHFIKFRNPKKSVRKTRKNNFQYLDVLYRRWSPGWAEYEATAKLIKKTFRLTGRLEAALGYYWSLNQGTGDEELDALLKEPPAVPLLAIAGKKDGALTLSAFRRMEKRFGDNFKLLINEEAGHFLHREVPDYFIEHLRDFLKE